MNLAVKKLEEYLKETGQTRFAFSKVVGCSKSYIYELMSGRKNAPSIRIASVIQNATDGKVEIADWSEQA